MASELFELRPLEELVIIHDADRKPVKKGDRKEGVYPYYGASGITDYVDDFIFDGDYVLLSEDGDNLRTRNTPIAFMARGKFWVNNHAHILKGKNGNNTDFICYALQVADVNSYISGSTRPKITQRDMKNIPVYCPPLAEQKAIAHILGSLDDKIELNRQMNDTLEAMAQALFKSWFVDFDPVIDNALAVGNAIPDEFAERAEMRKGIEKKDHSDINALFPDEFEFTEEMGWIPKGWGVTPVYEVANFVNGSAFKSRYFSDANDGLPIIKIAEIKNGVSQQTKFTTQEMPEKYFISNGSILFSWSGNPDTSIDTFIWTGGDSWLNQHIFNVVLHEDRNKTFVYYLLKSLKPVFTEIARDKQTTGLGHVTVKDMKRTYTIKPSDLALEAFKLHSNSIFERWYQNLYACSELTKLRDTLLPKLMSGELRIPDAAAMIEDA